VCLLAVTVFLLFNGCSAAGIQQIQNTFDRFNESFFQADNDGKDNSNAISPNSGASSATEEKKGKVQNFKCISDKFFSGSPVVKKTVSEPMTSVPQYNAASHKENYQNLPTRAEKDLYDEINKNICRVSNHKSADGYYPVTRITIPEKISEAESHVAISAYTCDNPQVFWIVGSYGYMSSGNKTAIQLYSAFSPSECNAKTKRLNSAAKSLFQSVPLGLNDFDREEYLFDYLIKHCTYDETAGNNSWLSYTAYGAIVDGKAVCEGYSRAMQLLAGYAGIPCTLVSGSYNGEGHMWNLIKIGGYWYHLDVTWCDTSIPIYNYYNVSDKIIQQTHSVYKAVSALPASAVQSGQFNIFHPKCSSVKDNYFRRKGIEVTSVKYSVDSAQEKVLAAKMKAGKSSIAFSIYGDYDKTVSCMTKQKPYLLDLWLASAEKASNRKIDLSNVSFVTDKHDRGLTIFIRYR
jgi:hypothetical protein